MTAALTTTTAPATHSALVYDDPDQYAREVGGFLRDGLACGHRALVIAPSDRIARLRAHLGAEADPVTFVDDSIGYAPQWNCYRVLLDFAAKAPGVRCCVVAEQRLATRVPAEVLDYRRLEAAINLVFAAHPVDLLCPYDGAGLADDLLEIGLRNHGVLLEDGDPCANDHFHDPLVSLTALAAVVPPPAGAATLDCRQPADVAAARGLVRSSGVAAGLDPDTVDDVSLAVTEVLTNALVHGAPPARLHLYDAGPTWVCHVHDGGRGPMDPLAGLLPPVEPADHGYGLWLARQLCTAVDVGADRTGTHVRLHARTTR
ncbi:sensor histidine kinase [Nocardioides guangzhouensis]|uniref:Sensor histidine kinase n=1 Tax=Nocardioides guangzhouensis TaxID=2497878 RepID=A0A4Q4ZCR3_9ACTN|nr:sensor histidine kinase [Nocardioides guangzhouensis]RYP85850.1 sensor histidine kinase [Nocardioides guangzhouensis]